LAGEIAKLRKALGDDPKAARYIQTVHTRGYRFIATVRVENGNGEDSDRTESVAEDRSNRLSREPLLSLITSDLRRESCVAAFARRYMFHGSGRCVHYLGVTLWNDAREQAAKSPDTHITQSQSALQISGAANLISTWESNPGCLDHETEQQQATVGPRSDNVLHFATATKTLERPEIS